MKNQSSVKRLPKSFEPDSIDTWRKGSKLYFECPLKRPVIKYYEVDTRDDSCTAVVRKSRTLYFELAAVLFLAATLYLYFTMPQRTQEVQVPSTILAQDNYLSVNVNNAVDNYPVTLILSYDGKMLVDEIELAPGESVGAISQNVNLPNGTYMIDIIYKINTPLHSWDNKYQAMLTVDYGKGNKVDKTEPEVQPSTPPKDSVEPPVSTETIEPGVGDIVPEKPVIPEDNQTKPVSQDTSTDSTTIE